MKPSDLSLIFFPVLPSASQSRGGGPPPIPGRSRRPSRPRPRQGLSPDDRRRDRRETVANEAAGRMKEKKPILL